MTPPIPEDIAAFRSWMESHGGDFPLPQVGLWLLAEVDRLTVELYYESHDATSEVLALREENVRLTIERDAATLALANLMPGRPATVPTCAIPRHIVYGYPTRAVADQWQREAVARFGALARKMVG